MTIVYLCGTVLWEDQTRLFMLAGSVGYEVLTNGNPVAVQDETGSPPGSPHFYTWILASFQQSGEQRLYGFKRLEHRNFAAQLLSVPGVGTALAARMMQCDGDSVIRAIAAGDKRALVASTKGLGLKRAAHIIEAARLLAERMVPVSAASPRINQRRASVQEALTQVGLSRGMIDDERLTQLLNEQPQESVGEIVRLYLAPVKKERNP